MRFNCQLRAESPIARDIVMCCVGPTCHSRLFLLQVVTPLLQLCFLWLCCAACCVQVALGFARLKHKHCSEFLESLVHRGKQLLLQQAHHHHHHHHRHTATGNDSSSGTSSGSNGSSSGGGLPPGNTGHDSQQADVPLSAGQQQWQQQPQQPQQQLLQQLNHECECLATDLSWSITVLNQVHLAREIEQLIRASGIKQESSLHPQNARKLWAVHAWLERHKLAGGHGLSRLLTAQQLAFCAAASRHTHRVTPSDTEQAAKGL